MKFKFCAEGDCPLWTLAALNALSSLPAQQFRAILHTAYEKDDDAVLELLKDTSLASREECARALAAVRWVVRSAHACGCPGPQLARDLGVLGVPRAHAAALADVAEQQREGYVEGLATNGFGVSKLTDISVSPAPEGALDALKLTLHSETAGEQKRTELLLEKTHAKDLLEQLKVAYKKMESLEGSQE